MAEGKTRTKYPVSAEKFTEVWNTVASQPGASAQKVADLLGMPKGIVLARKANYIKPRSDGSPGIRLLPMPRVNPRKLDIAKLNEIAEAAAKPKVDTETPAPETVPTE